MSYSDLLKRRPADYIPPKPIPAGSYKAKITKHEFGKHGKNNTDCIAFHLALISAGDDIDQAEIENAKEDIAKATPVHRVYLTEKSEGMLKEFLENTLKIPQGDSYEEMLSQVNGKELVVIYTQQPSEKDRTRMVSYIDKVLPLDD
jgi:hypothetical protein